MKSLYILILSCICSSMIASQSIAQGSSTFTGTLKSSSGAAISNHTIRAILRGFIIGEASTDSGGGFTISVPHTSGSNFQVGANIVVIAPEATGPEYVAVQQSVSVTLSSLQDVFVSQPITLVVKQSNNISDPEVEITALRATYSTKSKTLTIAGKATGVEILDKVLVFNGTKKIGTGTTNSNGAFTVRIKKLKTIPKELVVEVQNIVTEMADVESVKVKKVK